MIHAVDREIPIFASTWSYDSELAGQIDVWGIGIHGKVSPETIDQLRADGVRLMFTTDVKFCLDTPYAAIERLYPHYCFKYDLEGYEYWGISWLSHDPYRRGWHSRNSWRGSPGNPAKPKWSIRWGNGEGYMAYPGDRFDRVEPVSSIRLEQAREGIEDYEYLQLLRERMAAAKAAGQGVSEAEEAICRAKTLVSIPAPPARQSTLVLPLPERLYEIRERLAKAIEAID
jgi:hypothetical protein